MKSVCYQIRNYKRFEAKEMAIEEELTRLKSTYIGKDSMAKILSRPEMSYSKMPGMNPNVDPEVVQQVEIAVKYAGYVERQEIEISKMKNMEDKMIPDAFDYSTVPSLRLEARQKLAKIRPATIGQAGRISGVSPADVSILLIWLKRGAQIQSKEKTESESLS